MTYKHIWLQIKDEDGNDNPPDNDTLTWCQDRINDTDVEYVRADVLQELEGELAEAIPLVKYTNWFLWMHIPAHHRKELVKFLAKHKESQTIPSRG